MGTSSRERRSWSTADGSSGRPDGSGDGSATTASPGPVALGTVVIVGGGCYGTFYTGQLEHARARGAATYRRLLVIDRDPRCRLATELPPDPARTLVVADWGEFLDRFLDAGDGAPTAPAPDAIVPSPLMPHLLYEWLVRHARARRPDRVIESLPLDAAVGTPYERLAPDGTRYVSFADWVCPVHCVEPSTCPVIRAPRTWEMSDALARVSAGLGRPTAGPVLFVCRHRVYGVGMIDVGAIRAGARIVEQAGSGPVPVDLIVGTVSGCHGAVSLLRVSPREPPRV